jgi:O-antigen/teichoic acid export membrane protein
VPLLGFCYVQHAVGNVIGKGAVMARKSLHLSSSNILAAVVNLGANCVLVPRLGIMGAAWGTLLSYLAWNAVKLHYSARFYSLRFRLYPLAMMTLWGALVYGLGTALPATWPAWGLYPARVAALLLFPLLVWFFGGLAAAQKEWLRHHWRTARERGLWRSVGSFLGGG